MSDAFPFHRHRAQLPILVLRASFTRSRAVGFRFGYAVVVLQARFILYCNSLQVLLGCLSAAIITSPGSSPSPSFSMEAPSSEAWSGTSGSATVAQEGILRSKAAAAAPQEPTNSACACVKRHAVTDNVNEFVSTGLTKKGFKVTFEGYFAKVGMRNLQLIVGSF